MDSDRISGLLNDLGDLSGVELKKRLSGGDQCRLRHESRSGVRLPPRRFEQHGDLTTPRSASLMAWGGSAGLHAEASHRPIEAAHGTLLLAAKVLTDLDVTRLEQLYSATREEEWAECNADCGKYLAELDKEGSSASI